MSGYIYFATIGFWNNKINKFEIKDINDEKEHLKINDPVSFCLWKEIEKRKVLPEKVFLIATKEVIETARNIKENWKIIRDIEIVEIDLDFENIRRQINKKIEEFRNKEIIFNITGGTKIIVTSSMLYLFNLKLRMNNIKVKFVLAKRQGQELSDFNSMNVIDLDIDGLDHMYMNKIISGKKYFFEGNFLEAKYNFQEGKKIKSEVEFLEADFLFNLSIAFNFIDDMDYEDAIKPLKEARELGVKIQKYNEIVKKIDDILEILNKKESEEYRIFVIFDFFNNSTRKAKKGYYSMSLLILYRSLELLLFYLINKNFDLKLTEPNFDKFNEKTIEKINSIYKKILSDISGEKVKDDIDIKRSKNIYLKESLAILVGSEFKEIEDFYEKNKNDILKLINYRNKNKYIHWYFDLSIKNKDMEKFSENFIKKYELLLKDIFKEKFEKYMELTKINFNIK